MTETETETETTKLRLNVPWFESPFFERELERSNLDDHAKEQVAFFAEHGYLILRPEIPEFERLADEITTALAAEHATVNRVQDAWRYVPAVRDLATRPEVLTVLENLYGRRPVPFQTLNFARGTQQRTHSDLVHFNSLPQRFMWPVSGSPSKTSARRTGRCTTTPAATGSRSTSRTTWVSGAAPCAAATPITASTRTSSSV